MNSVNAAFGSTSESADQIQMAAVNPTFAKWSNYQGCLHNDPIDLPLASSLFGFKNDSSAETLEFTLLDSGTSFGFVCRGMAVIRTSATTYYVSAGQWFCIPGGAYGSLYPHSNVAVMIRQNYRGLYAMGGPVEPTGRLRYIDGCSDTLLLGPPLLGEPCFNLLHFPAGVRQTPHTHPSARMGMVISGTGWCEYRDADRVSLNVGDIFYIPPSAVHNFCTEGSTLNVVAYHPDSDWGPEHEDHPMINRTWVNGKKFTR